MFEDASNFFQYSSLSLQSMPVSEIDRVLVIEVLAIRIVCSVRGLLFYICYLWMVKHHKIIHFLACDGRWVFPSMFLLTTQEYRRK